jgi:hypothetical protein
MRIRQLLAVGLVTVAVVVGGASAASGQQLVDASESGGVAFVVFAITCMIFVGLLFLIDHVRRRN